MDLSINMRWYLSEYNYTCLSLNARLVAISVLDLYFLLWRDFQFYHRSLMWSRCRFRGPGPCCDPQFCDPSFCRHCDSAALLSQILDPLLWSFKKLSVKVKVTGYGFTKVTNSFQPWMNLEHRSIPYRLTPGSLLWPLNHSLLVQCC